MYIFQTMAKIMHPFRTVSVLLFTCIFLLANATIDFHGYKARPIPSNFKGEPLFLTPLIESGEIEKARELSKVKPLIDSVNVQSFSGYFTVNKTYNSNLFFWFFPAEMKTDDAPLVIWLQGGPGASSMFGLFSEHGPYELTQDLKLNFRKYRWNRMLSMLYIDNPAGTGYSFTDSDEGYAKNEYDVGVNLYKMLSQFYQLFPDLLKNELYVTGESYGGKYAPALAYAIHMENKQSKVKFPLKGIALGNGFSDPEHMLNYGDYLYELGLIDENAREVFAKIRAETMECIQKEKWIDAYNKFNSVLNNDLSNGSSLFTNLTGYTNYYNYMYPTEISMGNMELFIQQDNVREAIHVGNRTFNVIATKVEEHLLEDIMKSVVPLVEELLENYRVLVYNGQLDIIVAYPLTLEYLQNLKWSGAEEYKTAKRSIWKVMGQIAGYSKTVKNLQEVLVRSAGHMVPQDQPLFAFDLINRFILPKSFRTRR